MIRPRTWRFARRSSWPWLLPWFLSLLGIRAAVETVPERLSVLSIQVEAKGRLVPTAPLPTDLPKVIAGIPVPSAEWVQAVLPTMEEPSGPPPISDAWMFQRWRVEDGLPHNFIRTLHQTQDGYLWIGTASGLSRFDGRRFVLFNEKNTPEFLQTTADIRSLTSDRNGRLLVAAVDGILQLEKGRWRVVVPPSPEGKCRIREIAVDPWNRIWAATEHGLRRVEGDRLSTLNIPAALADVGAHSLTITDDLVVWLGNAAGLMRWPIDSPVATATGWRAGGISASPGAAIWLRTGETLERLDSKGSPAVPKNPTTRDFYPDSVAVGRDGEAAGTLGHRLRLHRTRGGVAQPVVTTEGEFVDGVVCVTEDAEGSLWCGTRNAGLIRLHRQTFHPLLVEEPFGFEKVYSVCEGIHGSIWSGGPLGAIEWSRQHVRIVRFHEAQGPMGGYSLVTAPAGMTWAGYTGGAVVSLGPATRAQQGASIPLGTIMRVAPEPARALLRMKNSLFFVGNRLGLHRNAGQWIQEESPWQPETMRSVFVPVWHVTDTRHGLGHNDVRALLEDRAGGLWVGTYGGGVSRITDIDPLVTNKLTVTTYTTTHGLSHNRAWTLHEDRDGAIWVGTQSGLNRFKDGTFFAFTTAHGLFDDLVNQILEDDFDRFWISCNRGIYRVDRSALNAVAGGRAETVSCAVYGEADGMLSAETTGENQPSGCKASDGRLYFATQRGVVMIDPREHRSDDALLSVVIEQVMADGDPIAGEGVPQTSAVATAPESVRECGETSILPQSQSTSVPNAVVIPPGRAHTLAVRYTAGALAVPERVRFEHRLVGLSDRWQAGNAERLAYYNHLKPGSYRFEIRAANRQGTWSPDVTALALTLRPFFWQTKPFYVACAAVAIGLAGGLQAYRLRFQRRLLLLQQQHALDLERARIARDIHDQLGANLSRIALNSSSTNVAQTQVRETLRELKDLIWSVNPKNDTLSALADFLADAAQQYLESAGIGLDLEWPSTFPAVEVSGIHRQHVTAAFKEALRNIVQHAQATNVRLRLSLSANRLQIEIIDNGRGFDATSLSSHGTGLHNLRERLEETGGECQIDSSPGTGTRIWFWVPLIPLTVA